MKSHARPRLAAETIPPLTGASVIQPGHPYYTQYVKWLEARKAELGPEAAVSNKRKGRLFLAAHPHLKRCWEGVILHARRIEAEKKAA